MFSNWLPLNSHIPTLMKTLILFLLIQSQEKASHTMYLIFLHRLFVSQTFFSQVQGRKSNINWIIPVHFLIFSYLRPSCVNLRLVVAAALWGTSRLPACLSGEFCKLLRLFSCSDMRTAAAFWALVAGIPVAESKKASEKGQNQFTKISKANKTIVFSFFQWKKQEIWIWKLGSFICSLSLLLSLSITLRTSKFRNQFTISSKDFDMVCYLKRETYSGPISFEVQRNDIWTDNIQSIEMPF